jgi:hypothetical protein
MSHSRSGTVHLRSLALLLAIFGVSAALAGYVGKRYEPVAQHQAQPATPAATPAATSAVTPAALPSRPATATAPAPTQPQPEAVVVGPVPGPELRQPMTLQSAPQNNNPPRDVAPPPRSAAQNGGSATADAPGTTGSRDAASPKCNQQACAEAYRSFDPSDCTYMPAANAPRRLCNKR